MPIDLTTVPWLFVALMAVLAFVAALLGSLIAFRNRFAGAVLAGVLFAAGFVAWKYLYPHSSACPSSRRSERTAVPVSADRETGSGTRRLTFAPTPLCLQ